MNNTIIEINRKILASLNDNSSIGLAHGRMGICVYLFLQSKRNGYSSCKQDAEQLLDDIYTTLDSNVSKDIESGLAGIALGIRFLIKEGFVDGEIEEVLEDIDNNIYSYLTHNNAIGISSLTFFQTVQLLFYFSIRLSDQGVNTDARFIFGELIIKLINSLENKISYDLLREEYCFTLYEYHLPFVIFVLSCLQKQGVHTNKIKKVLATLKPLIQSHIPILGANRLLLLTALLHLSENEWYDYMVELKRKINISEILSNEFKSQDIFISNGISAVFILLYTIQQKFPEWKIDYDKLIFYKKITESQAWKSFFDKEFFFNMHRGILNGITGVILIFNLIEEIEHANP